MNLTMSNFKQGRVWTTAVGGTMAVAMVFGASQAMAVTATNTESYTVSVVVDNAFTMTETTPVSFGTISAFADGTDTAVLTLNGQTGVGVVTDVIGTAASIIVITAGTPGVITITSAPPSTAMTITDPSPVTLGNPATTGEAEFTADMNAVGLGYVNTTDAAGELVIQIGGTLTTEAVAMATLPLKSYTDGTYTGSYSLVVSY
jgi:hypothetical protein